MEDGLSLASSFAMVFWALLGSKVGWCKRRLTSMKPRFLLKLDIKVGVCKTLDKKGANQSQPNKQTQTRY